MSFGLLRAPKCMICARPIFHLSDFVLVQRQRMLTLRNPLQLARLLRMWGLA